MYGAKLRIGLMVPCVNSVMRPEFTKMAPQGIEVFETRMLMQGNSKVEQLSYMLKDLEKNVEALADVTDVFVYGCTSGSFIKGAKFDYELVENIHSLTKRNVVSAASSIVKALNALKARKIILATPYIEEVNQRQIDFFNEVGIKTVAVKGLNIAERGASGTLEPQAAYDLALSAYRLNPNADALVLSCTNFRTIEVIAKLEKELKMPVVSSNQAAFWEALRVAGVEARVSGYGQLFKVND